MKILKKWIKSLKKQPEVIIVEKKTKDYPFPGDIWKRVNTGELSKVVKVNDDMGRIYLTRLEAEHEPLYEYPIRYFLNHFRKED